MYGGASGKRGYLQGSRSVNLSKPKNATRSDFVNAKVKAPKLTVGTSGNASLKIHTSSSGASGSATLKSTYPASPYVSNCGKHNKKQSQRSWSAKFTNGHPGLKVKAQIYPSFKLPNSKSGSYFSQTKPVK